MEVKFAFRQGGVHVSWQDPDGIGRDPGGIRSTDGSKMCASPRRTFRGRTLTGLDGILVGSDRRKEVKCAFRQDRVYVSWQDSDGIGRDPGGI